MIAEPAEAWERLGFRIEAGVARVGRVRLRFMEGGGGGVAGWSLRGVRSAELDGLPTSISTADPPDPAEHPNGAVSVDHVVAFTSRLERTVAAVEAAGVRCRRTREGESMGRRVRQAFFRVGEPLLEVVQFADGGPSSDGPARFWGLVVVVRDLVAAGKLLEPVLGEPRAAVQPGRRIATVRRSAGISVALALMTSEPPRPA